MNGWILKKLLPNIYNNHNYTFIMNEKFISLDEHTGKTIHRTYKCIKCKTYLTLEINADVRTAVPTPTIDPMYDIDCDNVIMNKALK